jgi:hypothetical protein
VNEQGDSLAGVISRAPAMFSKNTPNYATFTKVAKKLAKTLQL